MEIHEYEKLIIGIILRYPTGEQKVPHRIVSELDEDKFESGSANRAIYGAIKRIVQLGDVPNVPNVCSTLGEYLETSGGSAYIKSLLAYPEMCGVSGPEGFEGWVKVVDTAGRLRHLSKVMTKYAKVLEDFESAVGKITSIDEFLSGFIGEINKGAGKVRSDYVHVGQVVEDERRRLDIESQGFVVDLIPTGWPNLEKYFIPRPKTFGVIAGLTSMGKTQFALQMLLGVAIWLKETNQPGCVAINELETAAWRLNRRMACCLAGVDSNKLATGRALPQDLRRYYDCLDYISTLPIYIDDNAHLTSSELSWQAMALHLEKGPRVLGIMDYIELFSDGGDNEELRISGCVRNQRRVCWETGSCEIAISQFNNSVTYSGSKIGGVSKARYSGAIGHAADWFLEIYNPVQMRKNNVEFALPDGMSGDMAYVLVEKNKDHSTGQEPFEWMPSFTRFRDVSLEMGKIYRPANMSMKVEEDF